MGDLVEEIFMNQPLGSVTVGQEHKICRHKLSLYMLK